MMSVLFITTFFATLLSSTCVAIVISLFRWIKRTRLRKLNSLIYSLRQPLPEKVYNVDVGDGISMTDVMAVLKRSHLKRQDVLLRIDEYVALGWIRWHPVSPYDRRYVLFGSIFLTRAQFHISFRERWHDLRTKKQIEVPEDKVLIETPGSDRLDMFRLDESLLGVPLSLIQVIRGKR